MIQLIGLIVLTYAIVRLIQVDSETAMMVAMSVGDHDTLRRRQGTVSLLSGLGFAALVVLGLLLLTSSAG